MRRLLLAVAFASAASFAGPARADVCAGGICTISGCSGLVNVCPGASTCSGGVSVCPGTHPDDCHSSVDVCVAAPACPVILGIRCPGPR